MSGISAYRLIVLSSGCEWHTLGISSYRLIVWRRNKTTYCNDSVDINTCEHGMASNLKTCKVQPCTTGLSTLGVVLEFNSPPGVAPPHRASQCTHGSQTTIIGWPDRPDARSKTRLHTGYFMQLPPPMIRALSQGGYRPLWLNAR